MITSRTAPHGLNSLPSVQGDRRFRERLERILFSLYLLTHTALFFRLLGHPAGFDNGAHIEMLTRITWMHPDTPIRGSFYGYHPPLGFLLARSVHLLGFTPEVSIQLLSFAASLITFFFLRLTLREIRVLDRPSAIAFLYLFAGIPMNLMLSTSVNMDVLILALTSVTLFFSVRLFWQKNIPTIQTAFPLAARAWKTGGFVSSEFWTAAPSIVVLLCFAMLTKFSGVLLLAIPPLIALLRPLRRGFIYTMLTAITLSFLAGALVSPYYIARYVIPEHMVFPSNMEWLLEGAIKDARIKRDEDRAKFFQELLTPSPVHREKGIRHTDYDVLRLSDAFRDFWIKTPFLGDTPTAALALGTAYFWVFPMLILIAIPLFFLRLRHLTAFHRLGIVFVLYGLLQITGLIKYLYDYPVAGWGSSKGIYIAPAMFAVSYLAAFLVDRDHLPRWGMVILGLSLALFLISNHMIPAYA